MKADINRDKLKLIKRYFIFNMLQQPHCFINVNKTKKVSTNIRRDNGYSNNSSTEFTPEIKEVISENGPESTIPVCDKFSMAKFLIALKLLQQPSHNKNINRLSKNRPLNVKTENKSSQNNLGLFNNLKNKLDENFILFFRQITFEYDSTSTKKKVENENDDYFGNSLQAEPIIIEEKDIDIAVD